MEREAALVRLERGQRRRAGDVSHPGTSRCQAPGHVGNGRVRDAEEDDVGVVLAHGYAALAQAGGEGRTDAARTDDIDSFDHALAPAPNRMPGTADCTRAARRECSTHAGCEEVERHLAGRLRGRGLRCARPRLRVAPAQGEGAREAARAGRRAPPAPRAGDGRALAGSRPGLGGEQSQSGRPRGTARARLGGDHPSRRPAPARSGGGRGAVRARGVGGATRAHGPGLRPRALALQGRAAARESLRRLGLARARTARRPARGARAAAVGSGRRAAGRAGAAGRDLHLRRP